MVANSAGHRVSYGWMTILGVPVTPTSLTAACSPKAEPLAETSAHLSRKIAVCPAGAEKGLSYGTIWLS